jgi:hypothetical protein
MCLQAPADSKFGVMHGSAWRGDGGALLRHLARAVAGAPSVRPRTEPE